jgi:lysophospholipase L1-like esterase
MTPLALALAPVLVAQGLVVRGRTPVLPEAAGPRSGQVGDGPVLRVAILGESTAAGVGVAHLDEALAGRFVTALAARLGRRVDWTLSARTGVTAAQARRTLLPALGPADPADLALVVLGVNDTLRLTGRARWGREIRGIVTALDAGRVLLAGLPDLADFPTLPQPLRRVLATQARTLDAELDAVAAADPTVVHAPAPPLGGLDFAADGFHPGAGTYRVWADHLAAVVSP